MKKQNGGSLSGFFGFSTMYTSKGCALTDFASGDSKGEILLSREFLEAHLGKRVSGDGFVVLNARQRESLELVTASATFRDVVAVPKDLLEAFLARK
jgi:hypothetical protein